MVGSQTQSAQSAPLIIGIAALGLVLIGIALFLLLRRNTAAGKMVAPAGQVQRDATVVFRREHRGGGRPAASYVVSLPDDDGAYLIPLEGDEGTPGTPIPLNTHSLYVGRDKGRAQIVFSDPSVSRLHARLIEEIDGVFMLHDEGSASGTFVNDEPVELVPRRLRSGDLIEFGRQRVIFQSTQLFGDTVADAAAPGSQG